MSANTYVYDGTEKRPAVTVMDGATQLQEGTDYQLSFENNINAGNAVVKVNGNGSYEGNCTMGFNISEKAPTLQFEDAAVSKNYQIRLLQRIRRPFHPRARPLALGLRPRILRS